MKKTYTFITIIAISILNLNAQDTIGYWGFEDGTTWGTNGSVWNNTGKTWVHDIVVDDESNAFMGSGYFTADVESESENLWDNQAVYQDIPIQNNISYRFQMWARADKYDDFEPTIHMTCGSYNGWKEISSKYGNTISTEWNKYTLMVPVSGITDLADADGRYADTIRFPMLYPIPGSYYIDDITILNSTIAGVNFNGNALAVDYGYTIDYVPTVEPSAYTITVNGETVNATSAGMFLIDEGTNLEPKIYIKLESSIPDDAIVTVDYNGAEDLYYSTTSLSEDFVVVPFNNELGEYNAELQIPSDGTGVKGNIGKATFELFPNPATTIVTVASSNIIKEINIFNITGQLVTSIKPTTLTSKIDLTDFKEGVYIVQVTENNGKVTADRLLK